MPMLGAFLTIDPSYTIFGKYYRGGIVISVAQRLPNLTILVKVVATCLFNCN